MPTILSHVAVPLALGIGLGRELVPRRVLLAGVVLSMLPDLDVLAFGLGIPYADALGHRGFSHALLSAALVAALAAGMLASLGRSRFAGSWLFLFIAMASHGLLDTLTTGGQGIALLWPWSEQRFFAPWQVIRVSPLSMQRFMHGRGMMVLRSELLWIWLPAMAGAALLMTARFVHGRQASTRVK